MDLTGLLAYLRGDPTGAQVKQLLQLASRTDKHIHMTELDYAELKYAILNQEGAAAWDSAAKLMVALPLEFHPVNRELAEAAADIRSKHKVGLAASFAAALTRERKGELATVSSEFKTLEGEMKLQWLK